MKRPQLVSAGSLSRMLKGAEEAWHRRDFEQSFELLERAGRMDPGNWQIQLKLGQSYGLRYNYEAAERCLEKAIRVAPNKAEALAAAARVSVDFVGHQMAEGYYKRALEQKDVTAETVAGLAELYERLRRLEEAGQLVERALALNGTCATAVLVRARMDRQAGRLEEAEKGVRRILGTGGREPQIRGYYELGAILDRQGRYDEAMSAWLEAKAMLRQDAVPLLAQQQVTRAALKEMQSTISAEMLERWHNFRPALNPLRRVAFLCGHARSGTTLLEQVLDSHPEVVSAEETEIFHDAAHLPLVRNFPQHTAVLSALDSASETELQQSRTDYFRVMELYLGKAIEGRLLIDKNPTVNFLIPSFLRVFPEIKLLVAVRDPRDVCLSCFMQAHLPLSRASVSHLTIEGSVDRYVRGMGFWRTLAPLVKNPWLQVRYEDVVSDLESVSRKVLDFLELPWNANVLQFTNRAREKVVRTPSYADVSRPVFKSAIGRWRHYQKYFEPHLEKLEPFVKAYGYE